MQETMQEYLQANMQEDMQEYMQENMQENLNYVEYAARKSSENVQKNMTNMAKY
jgi:hypothetical protein